MSRLRAFDVGDERRLGGIVAGLLYLTAALTIALMVVLPGITKDHWQVVVGIAVVAALWGTACLTVIPWQRVHPLVSHFSSGMGFPLTAIGVAATGGAESPAHLYLLFIVAYAGYFYPSREAIPHLLLCIVVTALPLIYDQRAFSSGFLAEVIVLSPTYLLLGGFIHAGKARLVHMSLHDPLTGIHNRRALIEQLDRRLTGQAQAALVLVDLDEFKEVNTRFGHPVGDEVLCAAAKALQVAARRGDFVARLGGDEFALVLPATDRRGAITVAQRVVAEVRDAGLRLELPGLATTASVGYAMYPDDATTPLALMAAVDRALRDSKVLGKNRVSAAGETEARR